MKVAGAAVIVLALVVIAGAAVWFAAERHFEACVREAEAAHPVTTEERKSNPFLPNERTTRTIGLGDRREAIQECSRVPF